jgi:hypothetical protein
VVQQAGPGPPRGDRHAQCVEGEFLGDPFRGGWANLNSPISGFLA